MRIGRKRMDTSSVRAENASSLAIEFNSSVALDVEWVRASGKGSLVDRGAPPKRPVTTVGL